MFLFLPRCLSFFLFLSLSFSLYVPPLSVSISLPLFFSTFLLSLSLSLSLSLPFSFPSLYISIFLSFSLSLFLPHLSIFLSPIPVTLSFYVFPPLSLFSSLSLSFTIPVSLCIILSLRSLSFLIISHKFCGFWQVVYVYIDQLRN